MEIKDKKILVIGLAVSGLSTVKILHGLGARVMVNDRKTEKELGRTTRLLGGLEIEYILGSHPEKLDEGAASSESYRYR